MSRHFRSLQVIENVSKPKIAFSVCGEKNSKEGIFRGSLLYRYYERLGLLGKVPRDQGGRRTYGERHHSLLRFVRRAQSMGFSLEEIGQLLQFRRDPAGAREEVRALTRQKLKLVEAQLKELQALRDEMVLLLNLCGCAEEDQSCPIIESMEAGE